MEQELRTQSTYVDSAWDVGVQVRSRRALLGLSQQQLAERAGVGRRFIVDLEAGKGTVQFDVVTKVCVAVEIEMLVQQPLVDEYDLIRAIRRSRTPRARPSAPSSHAQNLKPS